MLNELMSEKNLWQLYKLSWRFPFPWRKVFFSYSISAFILLYVYLESPPAEVLLTQINDVLESTISIVSALLGFLIAGFTIFATLTDSRLFIKMSEHTDEETKLSWLQLTFVSFLHIFFHYICVLIAAVAIKLIGFQYGPLAAVVTRLPCEYYHWVRYFSGAVLALSSGWLLYALVLLLDFVFSIYHTMMLTITVKKEGLMD